MKKAKSIRPATPVLTSVALLSLIQPSLETLPRVTRCIESFLDHSFLWTLESAAKTRYLHLLVRLQAQEHPAVGYFFRRERFHHGTSKAAQAGSLEVLGWWTSQYLPYEPLRYELIAEIAARHGRLHVLQWLQEKGRFPVTKDQRLASNAAAVVYWLHSQPDVSVQVTVNTAAKAGDLEFMKWLQKHQAQYDVNCTSDALAIASARGDLEMIRWLLMNHSDFQSSDLRLSNSEDRIELEPSEWPYRAYPTDDLQEPEPLEVSENHLRMFRWLSTACKWTISNSYADHPDKIAIHAAACNNLEMIKTLSERPCLHPYGLRRFQRPTWVAARFGHLEIVQWLFKTPRSSHCHDAMQGAAAGGHLHIMRWIWEQTPFPSWPMAMDLAVWGGHLELLQWMHDKLNPYNTFNSFGCTTRAMDDAAAKGHLSVVKWLHENRTEGCSVNAMDDAAANGYLSVVQYLHERRTEGCTALAMDRAASNGHLDMVKWLHSHRIEGCTSHAMAGAASNGHLEIVRWLHDNCFQTWESEAVDQATKNGHLEVTKFLMRQCQLQCSDVALEQAMARGQFSVVEWLKCRSF